MKGRVVAKRYARALFELALEAGVLQRVESEMQELKRAAKEIPALIKGLSDERVNSNRRVAAAADIARVCGFSTETTNFMRLLVEKGRMELLELVAGDFEMRALNNARLTKAKAAVAEEGAAVEVKERIEKIISAALGTAAECSVTVDEELLGGFSLAVGDARYDASLKGKLERMKEELL